MEELNVRAKQVFELMKQYSIKNNIKTMGSEYIILAMYETEDSLCHFLLSEYEITKEEYSKFIKGEVLENKNYKGYLGIKYNNLTVGFGKASNNQIKNHLPKGLRIN